MKVQVSHSGKRYELELGDNPTLGHLKKVFHKKCKILNFDFSSK